eukprot:GHVH01000241.1.p1 GENE.GHVH01000241.1~~GHVH01000241.1.p1  ORF type:complete len:532 (+),score=67.39 GHVH01000241.1:93-1688(+)
MRAPQFNPFDGAEYHSSAADGQLSPIEPESDNFLDVFIFVNSKSGGSKAARFLDKKGMLHSYRFSTSEGLASNVVATLHIYELSDGCSGDKEGFNHLKEVINGGGRPIASVCGGDGSVMWMYNELTAHGIAYGTVLTTVIPFGTGNDFARSCGWNSYNGIDPFMKKHGNECLRYIIKDWLFSDHISGDLWNITLSMRAAGTLQKIGSDRKKVLEDKRSFDMINYFSIGPDARIGLGFDRNRSKGPKRNKIVYLVEGLKKAFSLRPMVPISQWLEYLTDGSMSDRGPVICNGPPNELPHTVGLVVSNVSSYMAGSDVWGASFRSSFGSSSTEGSCRLSKEELMKSKQKMGDGLIEILTARSKMTYPCEKISLGIGHFRRLHQSAGPITLGMRSMEPSQPCQTCKGEVTDDVRCYFNVDGEFFQATNPEKFVIEHRAVVHILAVKPKRAVEAGTRVRVGSAFDWLFCEKSNEQLGLTEAVDAVLPLNVDESERVDAVLPLNVDESEATPGMPVEDVEDVYEDCRSTHESDAED